MSKQSVLFGWGASLAILCAATAQGQELTVSAGGNAELEKLLRSNSVIATSLDAEGTTPQDYVAAAQADYRRMLKALYTQAYYGGTVSITIDGREASSIPPLEPPATIGQMRITVTPGPQFRFGATELSPLPSGTAPNGAFTPGAVAGSKAIREAAADGITAWRELGHAKAKVASSEITANHRTDLLDAKVTLDPGQQLRFGRLQITGTPNVPDTRLRQIAGLREGAVFHPKELDLVTARLRRTGTFRAVALREADDTNGDRLPIIAQIEARKPRRIGAGVELSNVDGLRLSAFWLHRNLFNQAQSLRLDGALSNIANDSNGIDMELGLTFERPAVFGPENTLVGKATLRRLDEPNYFLKELDVSVGIDRIVNDEFTISAGVGLVTGQARDDLGQRQYTLLTLPLTSSLDKRDNRTDPKSGYYLSAEVTPFIGLDGSDSGARLYWDSRGYLSFGGDDKVTLAGRIQAGSVVGASATSTPSDYLFYSGGGGTVRGQAYQSLGVELSPGTTIGGRSLLVGSAEARVSVTEKIGVVGFTDWGMVGADSVPDRSSETHGGVGIGVRYGTGLGPIRVDVATAASGPRAYKNVSFYIGIGQAF